MGRPGLRIGERGKITYFQLDDGSWRARCYYRDSRGLRRELTVRESTKGKANTALKAKWHRKSRDIFNGRLGGEGVTLAQVFDSWFEHLEKKSRRTGHPRLRSINDDRYVVKNHHGASLSSPREMVPRASYRYPRVAFNWPGASGRA
ncbi:hypothetical protein Q7C18_03630 [Nesterenkonia sp. CL21]|uniref:hypothetical protein n=1 Tax=Nesterenkonia sp. CL21 TaxID=3064894 RepID=UPI002878EB2A|nr:hypothetical protein [Nesterenkonia sp. CL21]MDS2171779.1 hypothetical protein [Nesterenkonia sp. CL21]